MCSTAQEMPDAQHHAGDGGCSAGRLPRVNSFVTSVTLGTVPIVTFLRRDRNIDEDDSGSRKVY